jgi:hypothetical protein
VKRFLGATYFRGDLNRVYAKYFADAGLDCLAMVGMDVDFDKAQELSSLQVYSFIKQAFLENHGAQAIYMLGPAWRTLDIIEKLEGDLSVPVVHAIPAQCWDIQRHLTVRQPVQGFGRLVSMTGSGHGPPHRDRCRRVEFTSISRHAGRRPVLPGRAIKRLPHCNKVSEILRLFLAPTMEPASPRAGKGVASSESCQQDVPKSLFSDSQSCRRRASTLRRPLLFRPEPPFSLPRKVLGRDHRENRHAFPKLDRCGRRHGGADRDK